MPELPEVTEKFVADTTSWSGPLREAGRETDRFSDKNSKASLAARKMGLAAKEAADRAAKSMALAGAAAEDAAEGLGSAEDAAEANKRAMRDMERSAIAAAEAEQAVARAADDAAQQQRQMARDAELAGAAQKLAALKAAGAVKEHNAEVLRLRKEMPELEKASEGAFKLMSSGTRAFGSALSSVGSGMEDVTGLGRAMPGVIIAGVELLPAVMAAAGGAITLGLGGAIAGVGILFAAKNKEIRAEYGTLGKDIFGHLQRDAQPFVGVLEHVGEYFEDEARSWAPLVHDAFGDMAPEVDGFAHEAIESLDELKPAFTSIVRGFGVQLKGLGPEVGPSVHNIATGVEAIGDAATKNPQALGELVHDLSLVVRVGGDVIGFFTRWEGQIMRAFEELNAFAVGPVGITLLEMYKLKNVLGSFGADKATEQLITFGGAAQGAGKTEDFVTFATQRYSSAQDLATLSTKQFTDALNQLSAANMNEDQAAIAAARAANAAAQATDHRRKVTLDERDALLNVAKADQDWLEKMKENKASSDAVSSKMGELRTSFIRTAEKMGYTAGEAKKLADRYGLLPSSKNTKLSSNALAQKKLVQDYQNKIDSLHGKHIDIYQTMHLTTVQAYVNQRQAISGYRPKAAGGPLDEGPVRHFADGGPSGYVRGPGTTTSDSIIAALSDKEYVVNAEATAKHRDLLDAINYGLDGFKSGGKVGGSIKGESKAQLARDATLRRAKGRPEYAAAMAAQGALAAMRSSVYGGYFRGGASTLGSAHGSVVQHTTTVHVHVAGSVWELTKLTEAVQQSLITNRMPVTLPGGRL